MAKIGITVTSPEIATSKGLLTGTFIVTQKFEGTSKSETVKKGQTTFFVYESKARKLAGDAPLGTVGISHAREIEIPIATEISESSVYTALGEKLTSEGWTVVVEE